MTTSARSAARSWPLLPLLVALTGCGGGGGGSSNNNSSPPSSNAPKSVSAPVPDGLTATLAEDKNAINKGDSVTYTLTLTNNTSQPITFTPITSLALPNSSATNAVGGFLSVVSSSGDGVYPPAVNATPGGGIIGPPTTLAPGQSATGTVTTGNVFSVAGAYTATALFTSQPTATSPTQTTVGPLTVTAQ